VSTQYTALKQADLSTNVDASNPRGGTDGTKVPAAETFVLIAVGYEGLPYNMKPPR
jgi:hypothetical protein